MSKLTSAQIIEKGDYLEPDFDPASLTIAQMLGVFGYHNINYPLPHTKAKLIQLWNEQVKPRAVTFKKEKLQRQNSQASDEGITDGHTGRPLNEDKKRVTRGASRRASAAPQAQQPEPEPAPAKRRRSTAEPALGGTTTRRKRTTKVPIEPLPEDSESDEPVVRKVSRKQKTSRDAGTQARRAPQTPRADDVDSGWEDNNIFQSGAESSSPMKPSPVKPRTRRISLARKKSMSLPPQFSPPKSPTKEEVAKPASRTRARSVKPPESEFAPELPEDVFRDLQPVKPPSRSRRAKPEVVLTSRRVVQVPDDEDEPPIAAVKQPASRAASVQRSPEPAPIQQETQLSTVAEASESVASSQPQEEEMVAEESSMVVERPEAGEIGEPISFRTVSSEKQIVERDDGSISEAEAPTGSTATPFAFVIIALLFVLGSVWTSSYKIESSSIGFCETGTNTNFILEAYRSKRAVVEECNRLNRTTLYAIQADPTQSVPPPKEPQGAGEGEDSQVVLSEECPAVPLLPEPNYCTPCPEHAKCTPQQMTCETGYLLRPPTLLGFLAVPGPSTKAAAQYSYVPPSFANETSNDIRLPELAYWFLSYVADGLPGIGPVAFPPRCVEDPRRKRHIGALGKALEAHLARERGRRLCDGVARDDTDLTDAQSAKKWGLELKLLKEHIRKKTSPNMLPQFENLFNEAIQQLITWGGVYMAEDTDGKRYIAHRTPTMSSLCTVQVKARDQWQQWRLQVIGAIVSMMLIKGAISKYQKQSVDAKYVAKLVDTASNLLRNQEFAHHADPVVAPHPYLSSTQLRDLVLQDEHSVARRKQLWAQVERIVEANANVRTNLAEVEGGDEQRVWHWVGSLGRTLPYQEDQEAASPSS